MMRYCSRILVAAFVPVGGAAGGVVLAALAMAPVLILGELAVAGAGLRRLASRSTSS
jgi:hypothetical protein